MSCANTQKVWYSEMQTQNSSCKFCGGVVCPIAGMLSACSNDTDTPLFPNQRHIGYKGSVISNSQRIMVHKNVINFPCENLASANLTASIMR